MQDPDPSFHPTPGVVQVLRPGLRRLVAPNPSPMTFRGTNTYLLGTKGLAVIDPGPETETHLNAILDAVSPKQEITHIIVTHAHLDHSPLSRRLSAETGAKVYAFGHATAGRSAQMQALADQGFVGGGEGVDLPFAPDISLHDGATLVGEDWTLEALHTPGHMANHISLVWEDALFSGDHVMGWATSMVSPPDGDLTAFMASLERLKDRNETETVYFPGHGAPIENPGRRVADLITHRRGRERQICNALGHGPADISTLTRQIYTDVDVRLLPAAERNVLAHLLDLEMRGLVSRPDGATDNVPFSLVSGDVREKTV